MNWLWRKPPLLQPTAALLGKLPSKPDFVRESCQGPSADALDAWLVQASPLLHAASGVDRLPTCWFRHCVPNGTRATRAAIGVLTPSHDSAGRAFPVAVFRECELADSRHRPADPLAGYRSFLHGAQTLSAALPELSLDEIRASLTTLPEIASSGDREALEALSAAPVLQRLFDAEPPGALFYALSTFASAFLDADGSNQLALDCPVRDEADARFWLELAAQIAPRSRTNPAFLLALEPARLLLSIAAPSPELLVAMANPAFASARVWPLTTSHGPAIEHARKELTPLLPELAAEHDDSLSIRMLGERLAHAGAALAL